MQAYVFGEIFVIKGLRCELFDCSGQLKTHMLAKNEGALGLDSSQVMSQKLSA